MNVKVFSWQQKDLITLSESSNRTNIVCGKDIDSPHNIFNLFAKQVLQKKSTLFKIRKCDPLISAPLYPFMETVSYDAFKTSIHNDLVQGIVRDVTHSDTLATVISGLLHRKVKSTPMLDNQSNDILIQLHKQARNTQAIFLFQNFPYFDDLSKELTRLMISGKLNETYRFLESARFYFLRSENEDHDAYKVIEMYEHGNIYLTSLIAENMDEFLSEIAPKINLSHNDRAELFTICGGSMVAIKILLEYLRDTQKEYSITGNYHNIISDIIKKRIADIVINYTSLEKTLKTAAFIGDPFSLQLLKWVMELPDEIFRNNILKSQDEFFIKYDEIIGRFTYPVIREYFQKYDDLYEKTTICDAIARGIYFYNPRDYWSRAVFLELAGKIREACEVYFIAYYSLYFDTYVRSEEYTKKISLLCRECDLEDFWNIQMEFYNCYEEMEYEKAWQCLDSYKKHLPVRLYLLKEYLLVMCIRKFGESRQIQENAQISLEIATRNAKDIEDGLWCDCQSTLISLYVNIEGNIQKAFTIEKELRYYFTNNLDKKFAEIGINILNRKSAAIYSVEHSVNFTQMSVDYFRNSMYSTQYLMALNNHAANLLLLGKYEDAENYLLEALEYTKKHSSNEIITIYLLNNYCVCQIHKPSGNYAALADLQNIIDRYKHCGWSIIPLINCAIYSALDNNFDKAEDLLNEAHMLNGNGQDAYFSYYINANFAALHYLRGDRIGASQLLIEKCSVPPVLSKATEQQYFKQRTTKWAKAMLDFTITDPWDFQNLLIHEDGGNQWVFLRHGFLCSDIQFWSEA